MKEEKIYNVTLYYRLVALWSVCEAFAGGIMLAAKIPFTGMIVSSLAVVCIMLIALHIPSRAAIVKATITVAFFKLLLSPHSPLPTNKILLIAITSVLIILTWYVVLAPIAMMLIKRFIKNQRKAHYLPIKEIQLIIPDIQQFFFKSWQLSGVSSGLARVKFSVSILLINIIHVKPSSQP